MPVYSGYMDKGSKKESVGAPVKRPRGRPRKNPLPNDTAPVTDWVEDAINGVAIVRNDSGLPPLDESLDPVEFVEKYLRMELWSKQKEMLRAIVAHPHVAVKSAHEMGKTFGMACIVPYWLFTRRPAYVFTTAPSARQVRDLLWREIRRMWGRLPQDLRDQGECLTEAINMRYPGRKEFNPMHGALGKATDDPKNLQGEHKDNMLVIFDESNEVHEAIHDMIGTWGAFRIAEIGNPVVPHGTFYGHFSEDSENVYTITINGLESPNFSDEECSAELKRRLLLPATVEKWAKKHGVNSAWYRSRVLAEFPTSDSSQVIVPTSWFRDALKRDASTMPIDKSLVRVGVDSSNSGDDATVIAIQSCNRVIALLSYDGACRTEDVIEWTETAVDDYCSDFDRVEVLVDRTGVGAGVADLLELKSSSRVRYSGVHFGDGALDKHRFSGWKDEAYFAIRDAFDASVQTSYDISFENQSEMASSLQALESQLGEIRWGYTSKQKIKVESKEQLKRRLSASADGNKRLGSPDETDALALALCRLPESLEPTSIVTPHDIVDELDTIRLGVSGAVGRSQSPLGMARF